jgi:molecular chaperone GrpE
MTMGQLLEVFDSLGVRKLESVGEKFDPALHNAVMHIEDETAAENTIVAEFQSGFSLGDKIIRHAMVKVAN